MDTPLSSVPVAPTRQRLFWGIGIGVVVVVLAGVALSISGVLPWRDASPSPSASVQSPVGHAQWQAWERVRDIDFLSDEAGCGTDEEDYLIGEFTGGSYAGGKIYTVYYTCGMGPVLPYLFVVMPDGSKTLLERDSIQYYENPGQTLSFRIDRDYAIPELQAPSLLTSPDGKLVLERRPAGFFGPASRWDDLVKNTLPMVRVFTDPTWGDVYTDTVPATPLPTPNSDGTTVRAGTNGFYIHLPSGMTAMYALRLDFMSDGAPRGIRWNAGVYAGGEYVWTGYGGCGVNNFLDVVYPYQAPTDADLQEIGRTPANEPILGFKDSQHTYLRNLYDKEYFVMDPQQKMAYESFVSQVPVFFWRDPLGRLVRFKNKLFLPQAECGKPVIYLYPQQTTEVSVQVKPVGGMSVSVPAYGDGWTVTAQPNGRLTDASGAVWPYLFWEGRGGFYEQPKKGWVIAQADVDGFLGEKLAALGLVANEIADFKEFWLPRMQGAPYYFITFIGNQGMDELAPLTVRPTPDTVIRVLMDFSPLQSPKQVESFTIRTPARNGFTVVEWGGVIR